VLHLNAKRSSPVHGAAGQLADVSIGSSFF
jgi:hypothetical protein